MNILQKAAGLLIRTFRLSDPTARLPGPAGGESHAGQSVTPTTALQLAAVWACVRLISETVATLPLFVYERDKAGGKRAAGTHPLFALLHDQPNADMTACEFWEAAVACLCMWGNAYARKDMSGGRVVALTLLRPDFVKVERDKAGAIVYRYSDPTEGTITLTESEIFHIKGFGATGLVGLSPIRYARHSLGNAMAIDEAVGKTFSNGMQAAGALKMTQVLTKEQRAMLRDGILKEVSGIGNRGGIILLEGGMDYMPLTMPPDDAQLLESRAFSVEEICRWFRVPPFMVGHTEKSTSWGTGLEQQMIGFLTFSLRPYLTRIEQAVKRSLIIPADRERYFAEFNLEGLLRADSQGRAAIYSTFAQNGILTRNEIRALENRPPVPGGDELTVQSNLIPISMLGTLTSTLRPQQAEAAAARIRLVASQE